MRKRLIPLLALIAIGGSAWYWVASRPPEPLTLTGIVTTQDVIVSAQLAGQIAALKVSEGDTVKQGQLLALLTPAELQADRAYYEHSAEGLASQVKESEASLRLEERQLVDQVKQAEAGVAAIEAQRVAATADLENAKVTYDRMQ